MVQSQRDVVDLKDVKTDELVWNHEIKRNSSSSSSSSFSSASCLVPMTRTVMICEHQLSFIYLILTSLHLHFFVFVYFPGIFQVFSARVCFYINGIVFHTCTHVYISFLVYCFSGPSKISCIVMFNLVILDVSDFYGVLCWS